MTLRDDLARWEEGYLSREELIASYASRDKNESGPWEKTFEKNVDKHSVERTLTQVLDLHERLTDLGNEPMPYRESDWVDLRESLPDRIQHRRVFGGGRLARPLIAASMVVGLTAGAAAASPTVREHMLSVWHGIQHIAAVNDPTPSVVPTPVGTTSPGAPVHHAVGGPVGTPGNGLGNGAGNGGGQGNGGGNPNPTNPAPGNPNPTNPAPGNPNPTPPITPAPGNPNPTPPPIPTPGNPAPSPPPIPSPGNPGTGAGGS